MSLFLAAALGRTGLRVVRKVKFLKSTFPQPGTALVYLEKRALSVCWSGAGRAAVCAGGSSPQGSWKLLAALRVCFLEGDLFVGVFVGTCEEMGLESNRLWPLWCCVCVGDCQRRIVYEHRADASSVRWQIDALPGQTGLQE